MSKDGTKSSISRFLRPDRFEAEPDSSASDVKWAHWESTFNNFLNEEEPDAAESVKLKLLINHLSPTVFSYIRECKTYSEAIKCLDNIYNKPKNELFARFILSTRKQLPEESISTYIQALKDLAFDCNFRSVTAEQYKQESIRDAFIAGMSSKNIRQRLLENCSLSLDEAIRTAVTLETAERNSQAYTDNNRVKEFLPLNVISTSEQSTSQMPIEQSKTLAATPYKKRKCFFCGSPLLHKRTQCPAFNSICQICSKKGHFANVCRSKNIVNAMNTGNEDSCNNENTACISAASPSSLRKATVPIYLNDIRADALIDTGSSVSFIDEQLVKIMNLKRNYKRQSITLASTSHMAFINGLCHVTVKLNNHIYKRQPLLIVNNLCADVILGHDLLRNHKALELEFGGDREPLKICNVIQASIPPVSIFTNMNPNMHPIAIKSKSFSESEEEFIKSEITKLLEDGVIERSISPWRAQVLIVGGQETNHRKRLVIDYSRTVNRFTELDAFPLPKIEEIIAKVSKYNYFSQIDLKSAYHQIPIIEKEKPMTAFEACGDLYQFTRIPFGVTNGVAAFQRTLQHIISKERLTGTFAYLDDVTICGKTKEEHDNNLKKFMDSVTKYNLTINKQKCVFTTTKIQLLGYTINNNLVRPDEDRLKPLQNLPVPTDVASLKRILGMFAHYSKWIFNFSQKIQPLIVAQIPLQQEAIDCFENLKAEIAQSALVAINSEDPLTVETDASEHSIAATLTQNGRPVAFFSRTLNDSEKKHSSIEKEACAIVEALRKWRHYLIGRHFILITDQQSISFMFNEKHNSKIKNEKIERWRLELSCFKYDIIYRPGKQNVAADALSRVLAHTNTNRLYDLHDKLSHPGVIRMMHWIKAKNLPYSITDIKAMTASCRVCAKIKIRYPKIKGTLIRATEPFQRLSLDFKGPLPTNSTNKYILTIIDEFSRFPFAYTCKDLSSKSIIKSLKDLFLMFGAPAYIHSDRGASFMSAELKEFLSAYGVATSRTTPYNPQGNGQVERLNGTLWKAIQLTLCSKNLEVSSWEQVLPIALNSIRSLLCTATNETPHERLFSHPRRSPTGESLPTWLLTPGPVLMKKNVRSSKYDDEVEEVQLLESNPLYSHIRTTEGREATVSNRQLAPLPRSHTSSFESEDESEQYQSAEEADENIEPRRSSRERKPPSYLNDYVIN